MAFALHCSRGSKGMDTPLSSSGRSSNGDYCAAGSHQGMGTVVSDCGIGKGSPAAQPVRALVKSVRPHDVDEAHLRSAWLRERRQHAGGSSDSSDLKTGQKRRRHGREDRRGFGVVLGRQFRSSSMRCYKRKR